MVKKKVDPRVRGLIEHGVRKNHRSLFILVGDHGKDQVENIHRILSKARVKSRPSVLWCYKKELGFSTHRQKRIKEIKKQQARGVYDAERDDPFDLFIASTNIRWTYYKESEKILGQTFGMCVLQDFEAITPNLLARTIETVEGGGIVILLMKTVKSLRQLYTLSMDVHNRFRTESHSDVVPRFNERFILSLSECGGCLVLDDELNILPISSKVNYLPTFDGEFEGGKEGDLSGQIVDPELATLQSSLASTPHVGNLVNMTKTIDQAKAVMSFLDAISEKSLRSTVSLTAGRGRGKSAAIGLCLAGSIAYGYSNIFVTAPSAENLKTCFEFVIEGLKALKYVEHLDFEVLHETKNPEIGKIVTRINVFRNHRQSIQYIAPEDHSKLSQAELVAIDEAAAIPLPTVKKLFGPYLVFMSSTVNGYEGTGRSLSLKLIQQLRSQQGASVAAAAHNIAQGQVVGGNKKSKDKKIHEERWKVAAEAAANFTTSSGLTSGGARALVELSLTTPIRYSAGDPVESWLNTLLCLDITTHSTRLVNIMPAPKDCELYLVDRDALFSFHPMAEALLQRVWALYTSAHYKNSPNDLQMLSDAPAHRLFVLLGPQKASKPGKDGKDSLPDILCVVQIAFEGKISSKSIQSELSKGNKASGDMIPWTVAQQYNDHDFAALSGARIVRIATHPDVQNMGYGSRAIDLLIQYFQGALTVDTILPSQKIFGGESNQNLLNQQAMKRTEQDLGVELLTKDDNGLLDESIAPKATLPPLLTAIQDRPAERLHWLGVSFGLTTPLLSFWSRKSFSIVYVRQTANDLTGEYSSIALKELQCEDLRTSIRGPEVCPNANWLTGYVLDYRNRLRALMSYAFRSFDSGLALTLLDPEKHLTSISNNNDDIVLPGSENNEIIGHLGIKPITAQELLSTYFTHHDLKRLELYARNMVDHHMILDLLPIVTNLFFQYRLGTTVRLSALQAAILLSVGLQHRDVDALAQEMDLPVNQILAFFNKSVRKVTTYLRGLVEQQVSQEMQASNNNNSKGKNGNKQQNSSSLVSRSIFANTSNAVPSKAIATATTSKEVEIEGDKNEEEIQQKELLTAHPDLNKHQINAKKGQLLEQYATSSTSAATATVPKMVSVPKIVSEGEGNEKKRGRTEADKEEGGEGAGDKEYKKKAKKNKQAK